MDAVRKEFDIERKQLRELDAARVTELKASMSTEKERLLKRVDELEKQLAEGLGAGVSPRSSASAPEVRMPGEEGGHDSAHSESDDEHEGSGGGDDPTHSGEGGHAHESAEGSTSGSHEPADSEDDDDGHSSVSTTGGSGVDVMQSVARLLEEQRKMMAAQVQAMAAHSIPPLRKFTGEDTHTDEGCFERWIEQFEDRAKMASWSDEQRLFQLKAHLEKTAEHAVRMLPASEKATYKAVVEALERRFHSLDIEELRGLEFHQLMQDTQSVEDVGIQLQRLARKAFPKSGAREFDRMLKGRFYQALLPKWQRKLGAPKPSESFDDLYARARAQERHDQQINARQPGEKASKQEGSQKKHTESASGSKTHAPRPASKGTNKPKPRTRGCFNCGDLNHYERNCPKARGATEASGKSSKVSTLTVEVVTDTGEGDTPPPEPLPIDTGQSDEPNGLAADSSTETRVTPASDAVGPVLHLEVTIEGLPVQAVVDCGVQSSIISGDLFDRICDNMAACGRGRPEQGPPTVKLYGKGGTDHNELCISGMTVLEFSMDGKKILASDLSD